MNAETRERERGREDNNEGIDKEKMKAENIIVERIHKRSLNWFNHVLRPKVDSEIS